MVNLEIHQTCLKVFISGDKSWILFPLESFLCPVQFITTAFSFAA